MRQVFGILTAVSLAVIPALSSSQFDQKLPKDQQVLQALDRLTFGPRPGDVERVAETGLKKWIDLQLHPERIRENPEVEKRLRPFESLTMSPAEVATRYPTPQMIQAIATGRAPMPTDPVLRASVQPLIARFNAKRNGGGDGEPAEPAGTLDTVLDPDQIRILRAGSPDEKQRLLSTLDQSRLDDALIAMPRPMRQNLLEAAPEPVRRKLLLLNAPQQVVAYDLNSAKLIRAIYSERQLQEVLTDFWYNHFNVFLDKGADRFMVPTYEREAIRPYVLGSFRALLEATAKSPAMLFYLDNWQSVASRSNSGNERRRGLNENYARELLELHTMGVDGGYTQKDVIEVARCFTGWTIKGPQKGGGFDYNDKAHDKGEKIVLGHVIPADGAVGDGEKVLDILARHPSTARFISLCLVRRFVADNPPPPLIDRMSKTYLKTDGDIRAVMKVMLDSKEFWSAGAYQAKLKTPFEMVVSSLRALNAEVGNTFAIQRMIANLGQPLYRKLEPTGYSLNNADWVNSAALLARMNFAVALAQNKVSGVTVDASHFGDSMNPEEIARRILFREPSPETLIALKKAADEGSPPAEPERRGFSKATPALVAGLVIGSPEFQRK
jgi:uncharacterized protein (DUF1800 family)